MTHTNKLIGLMRTIISALFILPFGATIIWASAALAQEETYICNINQQIFPNGTMNIINVTYTITVNLATKFMSVQVEDNPPNPGFPVSISDSLIRWSYKDLDIITINRITGAFENVVPIWIYRGNCGTAH